MKRLRIDIETFSDRDIRLGVYKYAESPVFEILLIAYKKDDEEVQLIDCTREGIPKWFIEALEDKNVLKTAFNAQFERVCFNQYLDIKSANWECSMVKAWSLGITGGLDNVSKALGVGEDKEKLKDGKNLIRKFSIPRKPTKNNPSTRWLPEDIPDEWGRFKDYCIRDVVVEDFISEKLSRFETIEQEIQLYKLDQMINDRGVLIDIDMAKNAIKINEDQELKYITRFKEITGIDSPKQLAEFKKWLSERSGQLIEQVTKGSKEELQCLFKEDNEALLALECRYNTGKTSVAKYVTMIETAGKDDRIRGTIQFFGARTGRWAGRLIQVHNLPQNHVEDLDNAREIVKHTDYEFLAMSYDNPSDILSQCIRPCIIPSEGNKFVVSDFSAIEARVIAWLAGEDWVVDVFRSHGKIYEATAARMLGVPFESIEKGSPERQKGKVATLALGYQGGVGSLVAMGALKMGIPEGELQPIVDLWRKSNSNIVNLWYKVQNAVTKTISEKVISRVNDHLMCFYNAGFLFIKLPSGRCIAYPKPQIVESKKFPGRDAITFGEVAKVGGSWIRQETYGGRLVENIVQAIARDCLAYSMLELERIGYKIVMHVHDEVVLEVPRESQYLDEICDIMGREIPWAPGLPLRADGYECEYYKKD